MISLTEAAQLELERIMTVEGSDKTGVRLGVKGGGCSGFTYVMSFENGPGESDQIVNGDRVPVYVDPKSLTYLEGIQIDYQSDLLNRGFKFNNPNATQACGCGTSFAV